MNHCLSFCVFHLIFVLSVFHLIFVLSVFHLIFVLCVFHLIFVLSVFLRFTTSHYPVGTLEVFLSLLFNLCVGVMSYERYISNINLQKCLETTWLKHTSRPQVSCIKRSWLLAHLNRVVIVFINSNWRFFKIIMCIILIVMQAHHI